MDGNLILALVDPASGRVVHEFPHVGMNELESGRFVRIDRALGECNRPGSRVRIGGVAVDLMSSEELVTAMLAALDSRPASPLLIGSVNLDHVHHFGPKAEPGLRQIGQGHNWIMTLDGAPIVWAARRLTRSRPERLAGSDCLPILLAAAAEAGRTVGFLGGTAESRDKLEAVLGTDFPTLKVTGHWVPERHELEDADSSRSLAKEIEASGTEMLVVGLGKPLQEVWLQTYAQELGISVGLAYGASADFLAGVVGRAPQALRDHGLEWAYRLSIEPRRLSRRYLVQGPPALSLLLRDSGQSTFDTMADARLIVMPHNAHATRTRMETSDAVTPADAVAADI